MDPGRNSVLRGNLVLGVSMTQVLGWSVPQSLTQQEGKQQGKGLRGRAQASS